jgi:hypothetical protein
VCAGPPRTLVGDRTTEQIVADLEDANRRALAALADAARRRVETAKASVAIIRGPRGHGSGFVVAPGVLATNAHVAAVGMVKDLTVQFASPADPNPRPLPARLLYADREADLALLAIDSERPPLPFADPESVRVGIPVAMIGNPGEQGFRRDTAVNYVTVGKCVELVTNVLGKKSNYLKTSAYVIGGNSGGPAINLETGAVVGVVTFRGSLDEGCCGICLPGRAIATALRAIGPRDGWDKRTGDLAAVHAAALAYDALQGDDRNGDPGVWALGGNAADGMLKYLELKAEGKNPKPMKGEGNERRVISEREWIEERTNPMDRRVKSAKTYLASVRDHPAVPEKARVGLIEMINSCEELTSLIRKPLKTKLPKEELKPYFARIKDVRGEIEKRSAAVMKALDEANGK